MASPVHWNVTRVSPEEETVSLRNLRKSITAALMIFLFGLALGAPVAAEDDGRKVKSRVAPTYPELAKRMNVTGAVKLQVTIAPNGVVKTAKVIGGHPLLVDPAIDAVKKWKYEPASEESTQVVEFRFENN